MEPSNPPSPLPHQDNAVSPSTNSHPIIEDDKLSQHNSTTSSRPIEQSSLFIGRLHSDTRRSDLEDIFEKYGKIKRCELKRGGYAFVEFYDPEHTRAALAEDGRKLLSESIAVMYAKARQAEPGSNGCFRCGAADHWSRECPQRFEDRGLGQPKNAVRYQHHRGRSYSRSPPPRRSRYRSRSYSSRSRSPPRRPTRYHRSSYSRSPRRRSPYRSSRYSRKSRGHRSSRSDSYSSSVHSSPARGRKSVSPYRRRRHLSPGSPPRRRRAESRSPSRRRGSPSPRRHRGRSISSRTPSPR